ncbi:hypothetical protein [Lentzea guizhouensis]|uniref:hypothetical protein n=1 Tax=Lentzea guizhouensis TaxID=1586287 RepID=UPI0012B68D6F|nr:hypothetical protein [Lentzea guizhouensis]
MQLHDTPAWIPYELELWLSHGEPEWRDCLGVHEMTDCTDDPVEVATRQLDESLEVLAGYGRRIGIRGVRIIMWTGPNTDGGPDIVIPATREQMALGRLRDTVSDVEVALREVENARTRLRNQMVESDTIDGLGRNTIARTTEGALARRLVLQFLAGHDLVRTIRWALPRDWSSSCPLPEDFLEPGQEYLGPYWCGAVMISLDVSGTVELCLVDSEPEPDLYDPGMYFDENALVEYRRGARLRAQDNAEVVLPLLHRASLRLSTSDGTDATVDDLAATHLGGQLTVTKLPPPQQPALTSAGTERA